MKEVKSNTDKCNICSWIGDSNDTIYDKKNHTSLCPICLSSDLEDINYDPYYNNDDENDEDGNVLA